MLAAAVASAGAAAEPSEGGVVVESVVTGFAAQEAGLRPGDVVVGWERAASPPANPQPAGGDVRSPFDLAQVEREQAPRGELTLLGEREGGPLRVRIPPGEWRLSVRPAFAAADLDAYVQAKALIVVGRPGDALAAWSTLAAALAASGGHEQAAWLRLESANLAVRERRWEAADEAFAEAARAAEAAADSIVALVVHRARARYFHDRSRWEAAIAAYGQALKADEALAPASLGVAWVHHQLGRLAEGRGELAEAEDRNRRALALREAIAPGSADVAASLLNLGNVAKSRGDLDAAEDLYGRGLALYQSLSVTGGIGFGLNNLGIVAALRGDLQTAESYFGRGLVIEDRLRPGTLEQAKALHNVGIVSRRRGDLTAAEQHMTRALAIMESLGPGVDAANVMASLGVVYKDRGDLAGAEAYYERARALFERVAPDSAQVVSVFHNLGNVKLGQGDPVAAEAHYRRATEISERLIPGSLEMAANLNALANTARLRGELALARTHVERALAIVEKIALRGQNAESALTVSGDIALDAGDLEAAERFYERALELRREMAPGQAFEAEGCQRLAALHRRKGDSERAASFYACMLDALDSQRRMLGGTDEARAGFGQRFAAYYHDAIDVLVELGRPKEAFHVLERYRARGFLSMLAERDLVFARDVPADLDRERRALNVEYERTLQRLGAAKAADAPKLRETLAGVRRRQGVVREKIRAASQRLAGLEYPEPLDLAGAAGALAPGTVLLSYSIGTSGAHVFAVGPGPGDFLAVPLDVRLTTLREDVARLRDLLRRRGVLQRGATQALAQRLGRALLHPVAEPIRRAERLLVVPDGPLHVVPFAALADPTFAGGFRYLAEAKPVHVGASATVFAELEKRGPGRRDALLVAFGDPDYSAAAPAGASATAMQVARERGLELLPLPASRAEVLGLEAVYPKASRLFVGRDATEENAKATGTEASLIHFATHGLADETSPLESTIALTLPAPGAAAENGLLQAWEIFEQLRIDADLVTLSACGTARGKEMSGEGILGLTRAFHYAGARSVLASLWEVSDASTAALMKTFYRHLADGVPKAEALRRAQLALLRKPATAAPYYWAAFTLAGLGH
jgi:CHAT domain-containing protein/tetratricopeptide (TPR) repeat protein